MKLPQITQYFTFKLKKECNQILYEIIMSIHKSSIFEMVPVFYCLKIYHLEYKYLSTTR